MSLELTREQAVQLHRQMWSDMQRELGDCPHYIDRCNYKHKWCDAHFPGEFIDNHCFLCEYVRYMRLDKDIECTYVCPIKWKYGNCMAGDKDNWENMPISELLNLPERECGE